MKLTGSNTLSLNVSTMQKILEEWMSTDHTVDAKVTGIKVRNDNMCTIFDVTFEPSEEAGRKAQQP